MVQKHKSGFSLIKLFSAAMIVCLLWAGCTSKKQDGSPSAKFIIQNSGSDTMVNLAQSWAEEYGKINSAVSVEVSGGGSGTGIAALINGTVDIANCSRQMEAEEIAKATQNTGKEPVMFVVGYDALAVYVHNDNPLDAITIKQLAEIYGEGGTITKWSELNITNASCSSNEIIRVSRQSNSGTYYYFRETLLGKKEDFKLGSIDLHGSKDVVELVERTPCAIGYSGMGYATEKVKMLKISKKSGEDAYAPNVEDVLNGSYPISRPLYIYSLGTPTGEVKKYLEWIYSDHGQDLIEKNGYVPLPLEELKMFKETLTGI